MDVMTAIQTRRSIRNYSDRPVEEDKLHRVLEAARLAPSSVNQQDWKFVVVRDPAIREKITEACINLPFVGTAPVILVCCGTNPSIVMTCGQHRYTVDLSIAAAYMTLEAHELGLGTCWLGRFDEQLVKQALGIPEEVRVVTILPLGYPAESPQPRPRKDQKDVICYDRFE